MDKKDLKPIGTEYWGDWYTFENSTDSRPHRLKWKVVNHHFIDEYIEGIYPTGRKTWSEEIQAIDIEYGEYPSFIKMG